jgi:hypothetical protein
MADSRAEVPRRAALPTSGPDAAFYGLFPGAPIPEPARDVLPNVLPLVAVQRCPPVTTASSIGWVLRPRTSFAMTWTGDQLSMAMIDPETNDLGPWRDIAGDGPAPPDIDGMLQGISPERGSQAVELGLTRMPLIDPSPFGDPREFQYLSGIVGVTRPGWSLLVRGVPNWPRARADFDVVEGVVETAWSGNVLPVMIRLRTEGAVVRFHRDTPLALLHPVAVASYARENSALSGSGSGIDAWPEAVWEKFVASRANRKLGRGAYRRAQAAYYREVDPLEHRD